jgi:predicted nucleic acid-binding protein
MIYFLDTTALLKRYVEEEGSEYIRRLLTRSQHSFHQSFLTPLETTSALYRRYRVGLLSAEELSQSSTPTQLIPAINMSRSSIPIVS